MSVVENGFPEQVGGLPSMFLFIFFFNLFVSGLLLTTSTGLAFFGLPAAILLIRATLWAVLLNQLPTSQFLASLPILALEGEGYVIASAAGIGLGLAWLKPDWMFGSEGLSRREAVKASLREGVYLYVLVVAFMLVAAVVESITIA